MAFLEKPKGVFDKSLIPKFAIANPEKENLDRGSFDPAARDPDSAFFYEVRFPIFPFPISHLRIWRIRKFHDLRPFGQIAKPKVSQVDLQLPYTRLVPTPRLPDR